MNKTEEKSLKEQIIDAARKVLLAKGYRNFSLRKIAGEIDVSATSIYLHFENKDDLVHTLMEEAIARLNKQLEQKVAEVDDPISKLEALAREYVSFALKHPREYQVIYLISSDEMTRYPKEKFRKARKGYEIVTDVLKEGVESGLIAESRPRLAAYTFWAQLHGVMSVVLSKRLDNRIEQEEFIEEAIDHIIKGYQLRTSL
ncbi:TetR/AcrR family transcriptional regulator [Fodinibius halophilus]|uniref:TetR/AcrR family transcriptional regulator n=1 Tax=Fodinibius halophilus TaxID=1736908 RepID=A0A6M1TGT3_9BACT|nr:TetR/AcrR family transcriptional regulator [Fodinibius halophilus]NGP89984.1 TetR/AcrR family transcriptional regulator [Fodinibius halophilus]